MRKTIAMVLAFLMLLAVLPAGAEEAELRTDKLTVGTTTPFSGNFFAEALGNNVSDRDVRSMIHGYSLVKWNGDIGAFQFNEDVVSGALSMDSGRTYTLSLADDLEYSDGTPVTAWDYAFTFLLTTGKAMLEATGRRADGSYVKGFAEYDSGASAAISGFRVLGKDLFSITINPEFEPYFYELQVLNIKPFPISVIAPGCEVKDDGQGIYLSGEMTAETLAETLLDPDAGYMTYPEVTTGPYKITAYDGQRVRLEVNQRYIGEKPTITQIDFRYVDPSDIMNWLRDGKLDLVVRCARTDQVQAGMQLAAGGDISMSSYSRNGLALISFCGEKGPTSDPAVRKALAMSLNREELARDYLGNYGIVVDGFYGLGQWMYLMANGTLIPNDEEEEAAWEGISLETLTKYEYDPDAARQMLRDAGWNLNEDGLREKDGVVLDLRMSYPEGNNVHESLQVNLADHLAKVGIRLTMEAVPMPELLNRVYLQTERTEDMIYLASNFNIVFDPSINFAPNGNWAYTNLQDEELYNATLAMRRTHPGDVLTYMQHWVEFEERFNELLPMIPVYSNVYFDFFRDELKNYHIAENVTWSQAIVSSYWSETDAETQAPAGTEAPAGTQEAPAETEIPAEGTDEGKKE